MRSSVTDVKPSIVACRQADGIAFQHRNFTADRFCGRIEFHQSPTGDRIEAVGSGGRRNGTCEPESAGGCSCRRINFQHLVAGAVAQVKPSLEQGQPRQGQPLGGLVRRAGPHRIGDKEHRPAQERGE